MGSSAINLTGPLGPEQFRNKLINGDFTFWQRGTGATDGPASGGKENIFGLLYSADRWFCNSSLGIGYYDQGIASVPRISVKRQGFTMGQPSLSDVSGSQYFTRVTIGAADGTGVSGVTGSSMDDGNAFLQVGQHIEANDFGEWSGKTVWLSFLAKSYGNITHPTIGCRMGLRSDHNDTITGDLWPDTTGVTASHAVGFKKYCNIAGDNISLTPEWKKFKRKFILPDFTGVTLGTDGVGSVTPLFTLACGVSGPEEYLAKSQVTDYLGLTSGFTGAFDVAQVQLEIGNDVSPFEKRHPQVELAMCQRYYEKSYDVDTSPGSPYSVGDLGNAEVTNRNAPTLEAAWSFRVRFKQTKRITPSVSMYAPLLGTIGKTNNNNGVEQDITAVGIGNGGFHTGGLPQDVGASMNLWWYGHWTADAEL